MPTPSEAVQVYLDSSDYSVLSRQPRDPEAWAVADYLEAKTAQGLVAVRFSVIHIMEMLGLAREHVKWAEQRLAVVESLCGRGCLVPPREVWEKELTVPGGASLANICNDKGDWAGNLDEVIASCSSDLVETIRADLLALLGGGRAARRRLAGFFSSDGKHLTPAAAKAFGPVILQALDKSTSALPIRPEAKAVIGRWLYGKATNAELAEAFIGSLRDPRRVAKWQGAEFERMKVLGSFLRRATGNLADEICGVIERWRKVHPHLAVFAPERNDFGTQAWQEKMFEQVFARACATYPNAHPDAPAPGLRTFLCLGIAVSADAFSEATPRRPKPNDFADCFHAVYAPYIDVFRADRYMAAKLRSLGARGVVGRLQEVPDAVEACIRTKVGALRPAVEAREPAAAKAGR